MQYGQRKLQRSVTEMRRSRIGRPRRSIGGAPLTGAPRGRGRDGSSPILTRKYGIPTLPLVQLLASEEYGLRCLLRVAHGHGGPPVPVPEIAAAEGLSLEYAAKLLRQLRLAGLVRSLRGASGGYAPALGAPYRPPRGAPPA